MRYLFLVYIDEEVLDRMPQAEYDQLVRDSLAYDDYLRAEGVYLASDALQPVRTATTLRPRGDTVTTLDGPFAETKEQLGGFYIFDCEDLDSAIKYAAMIPAVHAGCVEVRPILNLTNMD